MDSSAALGPVDVRERIVSAVYPLFARRGVRAVGIEEIADAAEVSTATFYRHFPSKEALVLVCLERRNEVFGINWLLADVRRRASTPEGRLLAIFDAFGEWFASPDFEGCSFIKVLFEMGPDGAAGQASLGYMAQIRKQIGLLGQEAGLRDVEEFTRSWRILMTGSIIAATEGDKDAAARAQHMARKLIAEHRSA